MDRNEPTYSSTTRKKKKIKCSFCEQNEASIILTDTSKPLCLLHYYTTRPCRSNILSHNNNKKIRMIGNEAEFEKQKVTVQHLFSQAFDELRREIAEESVNPTLFRHSTANGKSAGAQQQKQALDEKDPLSLLFDAPRRRKPQKSLPLQRQRQPQQKMQRRPQQQQSVARIEKPSMRKMNGSTKINGISKSPITKIIGATTSKTPMPKRRSPSPSPSPPPPLQPRRQIKPKPQPSKRLPSPKPQWQKIPPTPQNKEESLENEGGFIRNIALPSKIIQHQKRQQEEIAREERYVASTFYQTLNKKDKDELKIPQRRKIENNNNNRGNNPYKRRKITSKSIWNLALDNNNEEQDNGNNNHNNLVNFENDQDTAMKPSTPCPGCNKHESVIYDGNMTCRNDDVAKAETWGRKDRSDIVLMKCRCLDCGRVWNEDE